MQLKIFTAGGHTDIQKLEGHVNQWLKNNEGKLEVRDTQSAMCSVGPKDERFQYMTVSLWYELTKS